VVAFPTVQVLLVLEEGTTVRIIAPGAILVGFSNPWTEVETPVKAARRQRGQLTHHVIPKIPVQLGRFLQWQLPFARQQSGFLAMIVDIVMADARTIPRGNVGEEEDLKREATAV
jgi:hypothetical protein